MKRLTFILTFLVSLQFAFADTAPCPLVTVTDTTPYTYGFEDATPGGSGSIPCWSKLVYGYLTSSDFRPETFPIAIDGINTSGTFLVRITAGNGEVHVMKIVSL